MSKRVKSDRGLLQICDWQHVDELVREIGDLDNSIARREAIAKERIDLVKLKLAADVKLMQDRIKLCTESIEAFAAAHANDFTRKSKKLNFGVVGWRRSTKIKVGRDTLARIKEVFGRTAEMYMHIKKTVNKDALAELSEGQLGQVGAKREVKDVFYVEPNKTEAANYG